MQSFLIFVVFALAFSCSLALNVALNQHWNLWKQTHNKRYSTNEENVRRAIWESNLKVVNDHNLEADLGVHTYRLGVNAYSDMVNEEFNRVMNGFKSSLHVQQKQNTRIFKYDPNVQVPDSIDWRTQGYVTPVKDQGRCASCWAFSATGALEGQHYAKTKQLVSLSEQNLVDCSHKQHNYGCWGGYMNRAFTYIKENNGIDTETSYPYLAHSQVCQFNTSNVGATDTGYVEILSQDEKALEQAVATIGPISVAIDASPSSFVGYKSGVYNESLCSSTQLDHGVLVVGYGTENGQDYWLVKNSWGLTWGEQGYIKMSRNKNNQCGIATMASYPTV